MDDGSQKLLDVIDDPSALESFLGISGEGSDRVTLESIVDTLQQGLLEVGGSRHGGTGPSGGSLVLTQQQLQQLQFQAHHLQQSASAGGGRQFVLPTHAISSSSGSTIPSSASHVVLAPFTHHGSPNSTVSQTIVTQHQRSFMSASGIPNSSANIGFGSPRILGSIGSSTGPGVQIGNSNISSSIGVGNPNSVIGSAGISIGTSGNNLGTSGMPGMPANSTTIFGTSGIPLGHSGVLVGPSGTVFQTSVPISTGAVASPGSPFSIPTRSPASHAPPTPSPSPLPLRSPAHPPSPAQSPYQSPQNSHSSSSSFVAASPAAVLKDNFSNLSLVQQPGLISGTQANSFKDSFGQSSMVIAPQPRSSQSSNNAARNSPSPYSNMPTVGNRTSPSSHGIHNCPSNAQVLLPQQQSRGCTTRSPAPVPCGTLTPAPSPSPQQRTVPSPVIGTTPQHRTAPSPVIGASPAQSAQANVIQQTLTTGLTLSSAQQFPVVQSGGTTMLPAGNHQLVQIIHHPQASASLQTHTPLITTTVSGPAVHLQPSSTTPTKPKQPPQILPKPPGSAIVAQGTAHSKITSGARGNISNTSQHQGLHPQHPSAGTQVVIGSTNPTAAVIPTAQGGTLLLNQMIPGLAHGAPVLVQQNTAGGVQFILRPPTPGTAVQTTKTTGAQQGGTPMLISGTHIVSNAARPQTLQPQQILRLITAQGATMQLQQIQTPSGPTFIAVPSGQTLSFQQMPQLSAAPPQPAPAQTQHAAPAPPISTHQQPQPNTFHISPQNTNMLPSVLNNIPHSISQHNNLTNSSIDGSTVHCNTSLGSNPAICSHAGMRDTRGFSSAESDVDESCSSRAGDITMRGDRMVVVPPPLPPPKKKPKKKKKKKKDEETKLDLAYIMKQSGIDAEDGMTIYESEEQGISQPPLTNHQEEDVSSSSDRFPSTSNRQPSNLISQLQNGAQASVRLLLEDGKVVLQQVSEGQDSSSSSINDSILQNLVSSEGGHSNSGLQHNITAAQQLSALLAAHGNQSNVVFSQLLQQQHSQQHQTQQQLQQSQQSQLQSSQQQSQQQLQHQPQQQSQHQPQQQSPHQPQLQSQQHQSQQQHQLLQHQPQHQPSHQQTSHQSHLQQPQQLHQHHHFQQQINHVGTSTPQLISTGTNTSQNSPQDSSQSGELLNPKSFARDGSSEVRLNDTSQSYGVKGPSPSARNFSNIGTGHTSVIMNRDNSDIPPASSISGTNRPQCSDSPNIVCIGNLSKTARCSAQSGNCNSSSMQHHMGADSLPNTVLSRNTSESVSHNLPNPTSLVDGRSATVPPRGCLNQLEISNNSCSDDIAASRSHVNLPVRPSTGNSTTQTDSVIELPTSLSSVGIPINSTITSTNLPQPLQHSNIVTPKIPESFTQTHINKSNISNPDSSPAILGLHAFPNLQSLVSSGGAVPIVAVPPISSGANSNLGTALTYTGTEQLVIAHPGGLSSVLATPQLLQCIQQAHAQQSGLVTMPSIQLTPNIINKALGNTGITLNTGTGTILIGSAHADAFTATPSAKTAPTVVAASPKVIPQQPVIVQQLNPNIRRSSSDSNSSLSLGSPPPMISIVSQNAAGAGPHHLTSTVRKVQQSHQSIETQTVAIGTPCSSSSGVITGLPNAFLESLAQTHPNILVKNFGKPGLTTVQTSITSPNRKPKKKKNERPAPIKITPSNTSINIPSVGQPDFSNIASNATCVHQRSNTIQTTEEMKNATHDRLFKNIVANNQNVTVPSIDSSTDHHTPGSNFQMTSTSMNRVINRNILPTSNSSPVNPCTIVPHNTHNVPCHITTTATTTVTSVSTSVPVNVTIQQNQSNKPLQLGKCIGTQMHCPSPGDSPNRLLGITTAVRRPQPGSLVTTVANATNKICTTTTVHSSVCGTIQNVVSGQHNHQPIFTSSSSGVPHLLPFSQVSGSAGSSQTSGSGLLPSASIIQKVQTIQLTQVNQKQLKQVQLQIESFAAKKNLTGADQLALQKLYEEQKRILATGKVVPTVPGQHAQGLQFNISLPSESTEEDCKPPESQTSSSNTYLASLLRQPVSNQNSQISNPVRYHHQVGNHIIPFTPATQQKLTAPGSTPPIHRPPAVTPPVSVSRSPNLEGNTRTSSSEPSISAAPKVSAPCVPADVHQNNIPMCVSASVIRPTAPPVNKERPSSDVTTCEKSTSPIHVQVGTQTLPCGEPSPCLPVPSGLSPKSPVRPPLPQVFSSSPNSKPQLQTFSKIPPVTITTQSGSPSSVSTTSSYTPVTVNSIRTITVPATLSVPGSSITQKPQPVSPQRPTISRTELIEQQLNTDRKEACGPDVNTPFLSKGDACKRLVRYHVFNEQVLSEQDLEKADEIFEATAKHLLDKFRQMTNKYRYLLLMESMREVNTSELIMIDRMFVAEEHNILEKLQQDEQKVKEDKVPEIKQEAGSGDLREVRVMVQDVMKNVSIKKELEEECKVTVVKREHLDRTNYDEWVEIQKELSVYSNTRQAEVKLEPEESRSVCDPSDAEYKTPLADRMDTDDESSLIDGMGRDPSGDDSIPRASFNCSSDKDFTWERTTPRDENVLREGVVENHCDSTSLKRKESLDSVTNSHRKKRHKQESAEEDCIDDDINAQVQSAIDSILNLQRSEDGIEDSQQYVNKKSVDKVSSLLEVHCNRLEQCDDSPELVVGLCDGDLVTGESSASAEGDPALDEAVRSILTS